MKISNLIWFLSVVLVSCNASKTLKFTQAEDEVVRTESLSSFLSKTKNPKVVLRVNDASYMVTEDENADYLYNAIENQLLASGFKVRDRQLFNQIIGNNDNTVDYSILKDKSDTDLIIELIKIDPEVLYSTNKYYNQNNDVKVQKGHTYKKYGASVEFKVVMINTNEFAGFYKFNYTPCVEGCVISKSIKELQRDRKRREKQKKTPYERVKPDELEEFIKDATMKLVAEMRGE